LTQNIEVIPEYDQNAFRVDITFQVTGVEGPVTFSTILRRSR
jgi:hypothetical protein